jgi:hypothetical protein
MNIYLKEFFMKKVVFSLVSMALLVIGCGKSSDSNNNYTNTNGTAAATACPVGYYYSNNLCYSNTGTGAPSQSYYQYQNGFYADNYSGTSTLKVVNGAGMQDFFKYAMGVCDRTAISGGLASCSSYIGGYMDLIIQFPNINSNKMLVTFMVQPKVNPYYNYSYQLPSAQGFLGLALGWATGIYLPDPKQYYGAYRNPLQLEMDVSAINNSQGFEARGYGDYWTGYNRTVVAIQVTQGKVQDNYFNYNLLVKGPSTPNYTVVAQGTFTRCQRANCGL